MKPSRAGDSKPVTVPDLHAMKQAGKRLTMLTAYDAGFARVMDVNGVEQVNVAGLGGGDTITIGDLSGTDVTRVNADLAGTPGNQPGNRSFPIGPACITSSRRRSRRLPMPSLWCLERNRSPMRS